MALVSTEGLGRWRWGQPLEAQVPTAVGHAQLVPLPGPWVGGLPAEALVDGRDGEGDAPAARTPPAFCWGI